MSNDVTDEEITLAVGELRLKVSPYGASLRGLWRETADGQRQDIITGYTGAKGKVGGQGDALIPFPGRIRDGRYTFDGQTYELNRNDKDGPNAIHGFLRLVAWEVEEQAATSVRFGVTLDPASNPGYPFALRVSLTYVLLEENGLACHFTIVNTGEQAAPVAAGFHPFFTVGSEHIDADTLHLPFASTLEMANLLPTGTILPVEGTSFDFRQPRQIGDVVFNTCFVNSIRDTDGTLRIRLSAANNQNALTVWMDEAFNYVVLYSGDPLPETHRRRSLAIEPMTCASDAFNHPEWGLKRLEPGQTFAGAWGITADVNGKQSRMRP